MSLSFTLPDDGRSISENIALVQTGNIWENIGTTNQNNQTLQQQHGQCNKKDENDWQMIGKQLAMTITQKWNL